MISYRLSLVNLCLLLLQGLAVSVQADAVEFYPPPYHVSVSRNGQHYCSGAIVHKSWIITAASCVHEFSVPQTTVRLTISETAIELPVRKIVVHHNFGGQTLLTNNIALVKVTEIPTPSQARPVLLPGSVDYRLRSGSALWVTCRAPAAGSNSTELRATVAQLMNEQSCRRVPYRPVQVVSLKMLCAQVAANCQVDVGAPLVKGDVLVGILSSGGNDGETTGLPLTYTRVSSFLPWITKILQLDQQQA